MMNVTIRSSRKPTKPVNTEKHIDVACILMMHVAFVLRKSLRDGFAPNTISNARRSLEKAMEVLDHAESGKFIDYQEVLKFKMAS